MSEVEVDRFYVDVVTPGETYEYIVHAGTESDALLRARNATAAKTTAQILGIGISRRPYGLDDLPVLRDCCGDPRGRVKLGELAPGDTYYSVYSPTGACVYRTRSEEEAREIVSRNPERLESTRHTR